MLIALSSNCKITILNLNGRKWKLERTCFVTIYSFLRTYLSVIENIATEHTFWWCNVQLLGKEIKQFTLNEIPPNMMNKKTFIFWKVQLEFHKVVLKNAKCLQDDERRTVKQFHVTDWAAADEVPGNEGLLVSLMEKVQKWQQQSGDGPITVHCR